MSFTLNETFKSCKLWLVAALTLTTVSATQLPSWAAHPRPSVRLKGVNVPGLEYNIYGDNTFNNVRSAVESWKANCVRIPLNQSFWFGYNWLTTPNTAERDSYRSQVDQIVNYCTSRNVYVILDLHWSDMGRWGRDLRQHNMPDNNSATFWADCAARYANREHVIYNLYNEPRNVDWNIWKFGGSVSENGFTYNSPGLQSLLNTVRSKANNWVLVDSNWTSTDISGINNGYALSDPLDKTGYSIHMYPVVYKSEAEWNSKIVWNNPNGYWLQIGEWGSDDAGSDGTGIPSQGASQWNQQLVNWLKNNNLDYTAWGFNPATKPSLLADSNLTPTSYFGAHVRADLTGSTGGGGGGTNLLSNSGFEAEQYATQTPSGWSEWSGKGGVNSGLTEGGNNKSGSYHLTHWNNVPYNIYTYQTKTGLANGTYTATAWVKSSGGQSSCFMQAEQYNSSGATRWASIPASNSYTQITISNINVTNGQCRIGFYSDANPYNWINVDDVSLVRQ